MPEMPFDYEKAIERVDGDEEFLRELLFELADQVDESWAVIEEAISSKDFSKLRSRAHSIKGAAANLNVEKMTELFSKLEILGQTESLEGIDAYLEELRAVNQSLRNFLKNRDH